MTGRHRGGRRPDGRRTALHRVCSPRYPSGVGRADGLPKCGHRVRRVSQEDRHEFLEQLAIAIYQDERCIGAPDRLRSLRAVRRPVDEGHPTSR